MLFLVPFEGNNIVLSWISFLKGFWNSTIIFNTTLEGTACFNYLYTPTIGILSKLTKTQAIGLGVVKLSFKNLMEANLSSFEVYGKKIKPSIFTFKQLHTNLLIYYVVWGKWKKLWMNIGQPYNVEIDVNIKSALA